MNKTRTAKFTKKQQKNIFSQKNKIKPIINTMIESEGIDITETEEKTNKTNPDMHRKWR